MIAARHSSHRLTARGHAAPRRQRGAVVVMASVWILLAMVILGSVDIGNVFLARRDMQRVADLAALAAVQRLDDTCANVTSVATNNASKNGFSVGGATTLSADCGYWAPTATGTSSTFYTSKTSIPKLTQLNAVRVTISKVMPYFFFGPTRTVTATSTAKATNIDTFSIGATLAAVGGVGCSGVPTGNPGLVNALLGALLQGQSGTPLTLNLASYQGLACANVKLGDIAVALQSLSVGNGTMGGLVNAQASVGTLLKAMVAAVGKTSTLGATVQSSATGALNDILSLSLLSNSNINVASLTGQSGTSLLKLGLANTQAAADATVNVLDLVMATAQIAQSGKPGIVIGANVPLTLPNGNSVSIVQLQAQVISPPTIAVGEGGKDATGAWRTVATNAQIGLYLVVNLGVNPLPVVVSANVYLPLYVQLGAGSATLLSTNCLTMPNSATISAQPSVANLCIGQPPLSGNLLNLPATYSCSTPAQVVDVLVLGGAVEVAATVSNVSVNLAGNSATNTFYGRGGSDPSYYWTTNTNALGSAVNNALAGLKSATITPTVKVLFGLFSVTITPDFLSSLLSVLTTVLSPLLSALDGIIGPLLDLLGVQLGAATVHQMSLTCGAAQTVSN
ncbi:TadG family pilus assembly protein [Burkholderia sp. BCC1993]|uniref:TadG family pilus assembly protein n=1 Tax=Burkholderia sp. BCC1993 TaxID=2817444 RepID=UPI002AB0D25A|nr:TadG family pilus assembly protein [Burkholderia sp. BCC1993]